MSVINISDNSFIIKQKYFPVGEIDDITHIGCKWFIDCLESNSGGCYASVKCAYNNSKLWNINANLTFTINKKDKKPEIAKIYDARFDRNNNNTDVTLSTPQSDLIFVSSIECLVEIKSSNGIHYKIHAFNKLDENVNNTALVVEGKKLYVSKQVLASASPVFYAMFFSGFKESKAEEIPIGDVKYEDMEQFLAAIYGRFQITGSNVDNLLKLAHCFNVQDVIQKCEEYLINAIDVSKAAKLIHSENYVLSELQCAILETLTLDELKEFGRDSSQFGEETVKELYELTVKHQDSMK